MTGMIVEPGIWIQDSDVVIFFSAVQFSSVQFSLLVVSECLWPLGRQQAKPPCPSPTPGVYPNSRPLSQWCHPTISSSVFLFSSCPQSFPASQSFQVSQLFESAGQNIGLSASTSVIPVNSQDWSPLGWTGWISLQSKGLSRVFSNTTVQKHQFFGTQLSLQSNSTIHTWLILILHPTPTLRVFGTWPVWMLLEMLAPNSYSCKCDWNPWSHIQSLCFIIGVTIK